MDKIKLLIGGLATVSALVVASPSFAAPNKCDPVNRQVMVDEESITGQTPADHPSCGKINANNGWGNGDQPAPGNSLYNNNAENQCVLGDVCSEEDEVTGIVNPDGFGINGYRVGGSPSNSPASNAASDL